MLTQVPPQQPSGFPTLLGHLASSDLIHPLYVLPVKTNAGSLDTVHQPLSAPPPCDVHVVNLRTMQPNSLVKPASGNPQMALILHRTAIDCSFQLLQSVAACSAAGATVISDTVLMPLFLFYFLFIKSIQIHRFAKVPHHQSCGAPNIMTSNRDKNEHIK